jgi:hypothetical protein
MQWLNTVHVLNVRTAKWRQLSGSGPSPAPRSTHAVVRVGDRVLVYGGQGANTQPLNDLWVLQGFDGAEYDSHLLLPTASPFAGLAAPPLLHSADTARGCLDLTRRGPY